MHLEWIVQVCTKDLLNRIFSKIFEILVIFWSASITQQKKRKKDNIL